MKEITGCGRKIVTQTVVFDNNEQSSAPYDPAFDCPILNDIMTDPVICVDGHTYERLSETVSFLLLILSILRINLCYVLFYRANVTFLCTLYLLRF